MLTSRTLFALFAATPIVHAALLIPRDTQDTCGNINDTTYNVQTCLCLSDVTAYVDSRSDLNTPEQRRQDAINALTADVNAAGATCTYPDNAVPTKSANQCDASNPCAFTCGNGFGFDSSTGRCVCPANTNVVCNGMCVVGSSCPTGGMRRRDLDWRTATCTSSSERVCGVHVHGRVGYECIDVTSNLESCGGCISPLMPSEKPGRDCTAIAGVSDVECLDGACNVLGCKKGFKMELIGSRAACVTTASDEEPTFLVGSEKMTASQLVKLINSFTGRKAFELESLVGSDILAGARQIVAARGFSS